MSRFLILIAALAAMAPLSFAQQRARVLDAETADRGVINDVDESTVALHPATPYMESSSALLVDIDLNKVDVGASFEWLQNLVPMPPEANNVIAMITTMVDSLKDAGVKNLYLVGSTRSVFERGPIAVIPCENTTVVNGLASMVIQNSQPNSWMKSHVGEELVLLGPATAIDRVVGKKGVERPDLILPSKREDRLDHTMVFSLPTEAREDLVALWPEEMPREVPIQFSPRQVAEDVNRVIVSWRLPPNPEVLVHVKCDNADGAQRVSEILDDALALNEDVQSVVDAKVDKATVTLRATPEAFANLLQILARPTRDRAAHLSKMNDLKLIGLALHNYHATEKHFPPRCYTDREGTPLLSWRVALLPFIDQEALYRTMKLDQPLDSDENRKLTEMMIPVYGRNPQAPNTTTLRAPVYPGSFWHGDGPPKSLRYVMDGTSNTIAVIDAPASAAVPWADPQPWVISEEDPVSDVFGDRDQVTVLMFDGSARVFTREELTKDRLIALLTIAGKERIEW